MLDRQLLRQDPEAVRSGAKRKGIDAPVDAFLELDGKWREVKTALDSSNAERNAVSKTIGQLMAQGKREEAEAAKAKTSELKARVQALNEEESALEAQIKDLELRFPNLPHASVPDGADESENVVVREWGDAEDPAEALPHYEIAERLSALDLERGAKVSGSGFAIYRGQLAKLQRVLASWMLDYHVENHGYVEVLPPYMTKSSAMVGTGNLPKFADDLYQADEDLWLVPTAEVPVTNLFAREILEPDALPSKVVAFTACFRREAGAAGRETRGIQRVHQFDKVEMVNLTRPEESYARLEGLTEEAEAILRALGLRYRVVDICAGDLGDKGAKQIDLEVWAPGDQRWLEVSSLSNFEAFQARRANLRFRPEPGAKPEFVHTLNGSGLALPRTTVALLETGWRPEGYVELPEVLRDRMGTDRIVAQPIYRGA